MNYRHAFHAGNFADCMKHAVLVWLLRAMARKPAGFLALDTHAGAGAYSLDGAAERTGEWRRGIARLRDDPPPALADYVAQIGPPGAYPGSPGIIHRLLRPRDRMVCCEMHPEDHAALRSLFSADPRAAIHRRDGWDSIRAFLPPPERRALVLIDPPYEQPGDHARLADAIATAKARLPAAVVAGWYPIKHRAPVRALHAAVAAIADIVAAELLLREPLDPTRLNGCGLLIANPPYRFEAETPAILAALLDRLGDGDAGAAWSVTRLTDE